MASINFTSKLEKMQREPEYRQIILTSEKSIVLNFNKKEVITSEYFIACSEWFHCCHEGNFYSSNPDISDSIPLAAMTKTKMLVHASPERVFYVSPKNKPETIKDFFLSVIATHKGILFFCYDYWMESPLLLSFPIDDYQKTIGLVFNLLKSHHADWHKHFFKIYYPDLVEAMLNAAQENTRNEKKKENHS